MSASSGLRRSAIRCRFACAAIISRCGAQKHKRLRFQQCRINDKRKVSRERANVSSFFYSSSRSLITHHRFMSTTLESPSLAREPLRTTEPTNKALTIALAGNPNAGKTTLFNTLTGLRQKVANYPGVTVERKEGSWALVAPGAAT